VAPAALDDLWYRQRDRLMMLVVASIVCTVLALGAAIRRTMARPDPSGRLDVSG
jgi:hypothetical protein